jgi:hypothetical protein
MPEIGTSSSMSGDGKRSDGLRPQATAPILDSTIAFSLDARFFKLIEVETKFPFANSISELSRSQDPEPTYGGAAGLEAH